MGITFNVFVQVLVMFILIFLGLVCYKKKMLSEDTASQLSSFLLLVVNPCVILNAFQVEYRADLARGLLLSAALAFISNIAGIAIATIFIRKDKQRREYIVERFAVVFSNCGFMALPLIQAVLGSTGVFYASVYIAVFNLFTWTYGVSIMRGSFGKKDILKIVTSAPIISIAVGLAIFLFSIKLPNIVSQPIELVAALNTPVAMIVTGVYLARTNIIDAFKNIKIFVVALLRLIVVPLVMIAVFMFIGTDSDIFATLLTANLIATACPTAASTLMMSRMFGNNAEYASMIIAVTTLLSILTIPLMIEVYNRLSGIIPIIFFS